VVASDVAGHAVTSDKASVRRTEVDAFGAAQYEVTLSLVTVDGRRQRFVLSTQTATAVGVALIAEADIATRSSDAEYDALDSKYRRCVGVARTDSADPEGS
jgi:hypothetical protein